MKVFVCFKRMAAFALCFLLLVQAAPAAWADMDETGNDPRAEKNLLSVIDPAELQAIVDQVIEERSLKADDISIGYCYTATGETWYHNPDSWYYSASLYKVPLMMLLAEKEHNGEIDRDTTKLNGVTLAYAEDVILVHSNNDYAHVMMNYLGGDRLCREMYQQFSPMDPEDYHDNFYDYSYFTARFMTDVLQTLYYEQERFPNIIESLELANPGQYFRMTESEYEIAQKYGSYLEGTGIDYNHNAGIIFTPNPFILTVMTRNTGMIEELSFELEQKFLDYTLQLDGRLPQAQEEYDRQQAEAEEAARLAAEQPAETELSGQQDTAPDPAAGTEAETLPEPEPERKASSLGLILAVSAAAAFVTAVLLGFLIRRWRRNQEEAGYGEEEEFQPEPPARQERSARRERPARQEEPPVRTERPARQEPKKKKGGYTPRH